MSKGPPTSLCVRGGGTHTPKKVPPPPPQHPRPPPPSPHPAPLRQPQGWRMGIKINRLGFFLWGASYAASHPPRMSIGAGGSGTHRPRRIKALGGGEMMLCTPPTYLHAGGLGDETKSRKMGGSPRWSPPPQPPQTLPAGGGCCGRHPPPPPQSILTKGRPPRAGPAPATPRLAPPPGRDPPQITDTPKARLLARSLIANRGK